MKYPEVAFFLLVVTMSSNSQVVCSKGNLVSLLLLTLDDYETSVSNLKL